MVVIDAPPFPNFQKYKNSFEKVKKSYKELKKIISEIDEKVKNIEEKGSKKLSKYIDNRYCSNYDKEKEKVPRNVFSPVTREPKPKKRSFRLRNEETASEPPSDSPHKFTLNTNDTNKKILEKRNTIESMNKIREVSYDPSSSEQETVHPIFKSKPKEKTGNKKIRYHNHPLTPQNKPRLENQRTNVLNRINFKSMMYTGVLGIISGLTAAQIS